MEECFRPSSSDQECYVFFAPDYTGRRLRPSTSAARSFVSPSSSPPKTRLKPTISMWYLTVPRRRSQRSSFVHTRRKSGCPSATATFVFTKHLLRLILVTTPLRGVLGVAPKAQGSSTR